MLNTRVHEIAWSLSQLVPINKPKSSFTPPVLIYIKLSLFEANMTWWLYVIQSLAYLEFRF